MFPWMYVTLLHTFHRRNVLLRFLLSVFLSNVSFCSQLSSGSLLLTARHSSTAYLLWSYASCIVWLMAWLRVSNLSVSISTLLTTKEKEEVCVSPCAFFVHACECVCGRCVHKFYARHRRAEIDEWKYCSFYLKPIRRGKCGAAKMATFNVVICQKDSENRPGMEEEGIYLCLVAHKTRKENTVVLFRRKWECSGPLQMYRSRDTGMIFTNMHLMKKKKKMLCFLMWGLYGKIFKAWQSEFHLFSVHVTHTQIHIHPHTVVCSTGCLILTQRALGCYCVSETGSACSVLSMSDCRDIALMSLRITWLVFPISKSLCRKGHVCVLLCNSTVGYDI